MRDDAVRWVLVAATALVAAGCSTGTPPSAGVPDEARAVPTTPVATNPAQADRAVIPSQVVEEAFTAALPDATPTAVGDVTPHEGVIDCPDGVAARATATTECTWTTPDGATRGVTATVTSVEDDGTARFSFDVASVVTPAPSTDAGGS